MSLIRSSRRPAMVIAALAVIAVGSLSVRAEDVEKPWDRSVALGLTLARGNSHSETLHGEITGKKIWAADELRLGLDGTYGFNSGATSAEALHGVAQYNHLFNERLYGSLLAELLHDGVAAVAYRVTLSPSVGYYFIKTDLTRLSGECGPGFIINKENSVPENTYVTLRLAERFERKLSAGAKLWQSLEWLPKFGDFGDYLLNAEIGAEAAMTKAFSVRVVAQDRYDSRPALGRKKNDILLVSSLVYKF